MNQNLNQNGNPIQQLPPFRLYGLIGCPHCARAEEYLRARMLPAFVIVANGDPIAEAGIKALTQKDPTEYPVLCCTLNNKIITGFKEAEYDELSRLYHTLAAAGAFASAGLPSNSGSGKQPDGPATAPVAGDTAGAN